jgi:signal transduction histidine kinase/CHASE3 domain sensor protein
MLTVAFATLISLMAVLGLVRVLVTEPLYRAADARRTHLVEIRDANHRVRTLVDRAQLALDGYLLTGDRTLLVPYATSRDESPAAMAELMRLAGPDNVEATAVKERVVEWRRQADALADSQPVQNPSQIGENKGAYHRAVVASDALNDTVQRGLSEAFYDVKHLRTVTLLAAILITLVSIAVAIVIGVRTTRRIVRPLGRVVTVLDRFTGGELDARVSTADSPLEIAAVGVAVNGMADEVLLARDRYEGEQRMYREVQELGSVVRRQNAVGPAVSAAAGGLGEALHADHVVIRLAGQEGRLHGPTVWSAPESLGDPSGLADTPVDWFPAHREKPLVLDEVSADHTAMPGRERAALRAAGAGTVIMAKLGEGDDQLGHVTLVRRAGAPAWGPFDVGLVELSVNDLARTLVNARLYEREQRLVRQLQEVNETKRGFMSTVSHELRTPLTSIAGYLELLRDEEAGPLTPAQARMLEVVDRNTTRLRALIEDLLIVSRIEEGTYQATLADVDGAATVIGAVHAMEPVAEKAGVVLVSDVAGPLPLRGDPDQLDRMVMNLLSNAVKFTPSGGDVAVTAYRDGDDVIISVRDTGIGIPAADQARLFGRFVRASNATEMAIPGTGLGLSIVYAIVDQHGGAITLDSQEGEGSTFTVLLPADKAAVEPPAADK